jgi:hypothetical protein
MGFDGETKSLFAFFGSSPLMRLISTFARRFSVGPRNMPKREFPPLYKSSGNESVDRLAFFHILERLKVNISKLEPASALMSFKTQKRTGWLNNNVCHL